MQLGTISISSLYNSAVDLKSPPGSVHSGTQTNCRPDVILTLSDGDVVDMVAGKLNAQKVRLEGNHLAD